MHVHLIVFLNWMHNPCGMSWYSYWKFWWPIIISAKLEAKDRMCESSSHNLNKFHFKNYLSWWARSNLVKTNLIGQLYLNNVSLRRDLIQEQTQERHVFKRDCLRCSNYINRPRHYNPHNLGDLYEWFMRMRKLEAL